MLGVGEKYLESDFICLVSVMQKEVQKSRNHA